MKPRLPTAASAIVMALSFCLTTLLLAPSMATAQETFVIKPAADKKLKELPPGPFYWRVDNFPTLTQARAAEGPASLSAEVAGKAWLFTLSAAGGSTLGGTKVAGSDPCHR